MKYTKGEITEFTKQLIKTNKYMWLALMECEELVQSEMFRDINSDICSNENVFQAIAERFKKLSFDTTIAETELNGSYLQEFDRFGRKLSEYLE